MKISSFVVIFLVKLYNIAMEKTTTVEIAKRYTDNTYANKDEVRRGLNTSLVDPFWNAILSYRSQYSKPIRLYTVSMLSYCVCNTPTIGQKCSDITSRLAQCLSTFIGLDEGEKERVRYKCAYDSVAYVGQAYGETFSRDFIVTLINGEAKNMQGLSIAKQKAIAFYDAYKRLGEKRVTIDENFLVELYVTISKKEITSIYRNFDFTNNMSVINREHNGITFRNIQKHMDILYSFLGDNKLSVIYKAAAAYYYINYVKPFPDYNNEIAVLLLKAIIGNDNKEQIGYLLPFEELLKHYETFLIDFKEVNRGNDLTYVLMRIITYATGIIETFLDNCTNTKIDDLRHEHLSGPIENTPSEVKSTSEPKTQEKVDTPVKETVGSVAIPTIESGLEEKDANKFEKYLLEKNPMLKKAQAHFYARHCTMGSFYTIQMYKKAEKVVYETARTSMDTLAEFGYYEKRQVKNKFVYTPIKVKEDKKDEPTNA